MYSGNDSLNEHQTPYIASDELRKEISQLEHAIDHKLAAYSLFSERIGEWKQEDEVAFSASEHSDELAILLNKVCFYSLYSQN